MRARREVFSWTIVVTSVLSTGMLNDAAAQDADSPEGKKPTQAVDARLPVYVTPYYNSSGPVIEVGRFSKELREADAKSIADVTARMKKDWATLSVAQMYVAAIRLFDLGHRDEAVYWFYSAQYRARLFMLLTLGDEVKLKQRADEKVPAILMKYVPAHQAFFAVVGIYVNVYAFKRPAMLKKTIQTVVKENAALPKLREVYPLVTFIPDDMWRARNQQLAEGLKKLEAIVSELKPDGSIATQEELEQAFRKQSPLMVAFDAGDKAQFKKLLQSGADPNCRPKVGTALLHLAAENADPDWLRMLLKHDADPNLVSSGHPYAPDLTPLFFAVDKARQGNIVQLISAGADVNYCAERKQTLLKLAQRRRFWQTVLELLKSGADPRLPESNPSFPAINDRYWREEYETLTDVDRRRRKRENKEYGVDITLEQEKEQYYVVRDWLMRKGYLKEVNTDQKP